MAIANFLLTASPRGVGGWEQGKWACQHRSGQDVLINSQQDKCYFLSHNLLSLYELKILCLWTSSLGAEPLECIFQAIGNIPLQSCRSSIDKHRKQSTRFRAKGRDPAWGQGVLCYRFGQERCSDFKDSRDQIGSTEITHCNHSVSSSLT